MFYAALQAYMGFPYDPYDALLVNGLVAWVLLALFTWFLFHVSWRS